LLTAVRGERELAELAASPPLGPERIALPAWRLPGRREQRPQQAAGCFAIAEFCSEKV